MDQVAAYLSEDGTGPWGQWHIPDLVPVGGAPRLTFVFESPHKDELADGRRPVMGSAGVSALRFLLEEATDPLGRFVDQHPAAAASIAILNVSNVPMQRVAFEGPTGPDLDDEQWSVIERARTSGTRPVSRMREGAVRSATELLIENLRTRLHALQLTGPVVPSGVFAQRVVSAALSDSSAALIEIPHPSYNQWRRATGDDLDALEQVRAIFRSIVGDAASG